MAKLFETSKDIADLAQEKWENTGLAQMGIELKVISTPKAKSILKVQRANATTNYLTKKDVILIVFEEAFDRLTDKDKLNVESDFAREIFRMRRKYQNYVDVAEESYIVIETIEEEEKQRKEAERLAKKERKNNK